MYKPENKTKQQLIDLLNNTPLFGGIRPDTLQLMLKQSQVIEKTKGQRFFKENELADSMFILLKGEIAIQKIWREKTYEITYLYPGDCFGEMAIIDHCARSASVIALNTCEAIELNIECFNKIYAEDIKQYTMLQMNMGREVSRRLRQANDLLFQSRVEKDLKDNTHQATV